MFLPAFAPQPPAGMVIEDVVPLESCGLARLLRDPQESGRTLVLDCRPFLAYCQAHLLDARPVHWNGLLRRRSRGRSGVGLERLVPDRALLARLRKGELAHLVVLDEAGGSVSALRPDSLARLLLNALLREERAGTSHIYLLQGKKPAWSSPPPLLPSRPGLGGGGVQRQG